jgi:hypothetical protein
MDKINLIRKTLKQKHKKNKTIILIKFKIAKIINYLLLLFIVLNAHKSCNFRKFRNKIYHAMIVIVYLKRIKKVIVALNVMYICAINVVRIKNKKVLHKKKVINIINYK